MKKYLQDLKAMLTIRRKGKRDQYRSVKEQIASEDYVAGLTCMNCNIPLTGPFCHICGQKDDDLRRPVWTFVRDILDDFLSTDSRILKSIILLVLVPGGLTRAFMMGRRARFVPPLRLYLVISISFFLMLSLMNIAIVDINLTYNPEKAAALSSKSDTEFAQENIPETIVDTAGISQKDATVSVLETLVSPPTDEEVLTELEKIKAEVLAEIEAEEHLTDEQKQKLRELADSKIIGIPTRGEDGNLEPSQFQIDNLPYDVDVGMFVPISDEPRDGLRQEDLDRIMNDSDRNETVRGLIEGFAKALKDPTLLNDLFNDWLPRALFVLMPIFAIILRVFHWGKERNYVNQLVFSLHFHSFLFLLLMGMMFLIPMVGGQMGVELFWLSTSLYLIIALKVGESQGIIRAFFKAGFIYVSYLILMTATLMYVIYEGLQEL
jgi:hypothetical protein